ncbi:MAG: bacillithiol system redox-active protein YtxJ [Emticicia sp.]|uniref:bacillithiol system redox-active protein YtxJ n=1 Tax=Emticicia sp. TaxID=1930953 RepID=UPI003BA80CA7
MNWNNLTEENQLEEIKQESYNQPVMILKHSTTCSISATALSRLERSWKDEVAKDLKPYYLDLLKLRPISNKIAQEFGVEHESPQILIIKNGQSVYDASHFDIRFDEIVNHI